MRAIRSTATGRSWSGRKARRAGVLVILALLAAVSGTLMQSRSGASATAASRQPKANVVAAQTNPSGSVATPPPPAPAHETVDLFGDSLGYQAEPYLDMFFAETGHYTVSNNTYGGTATCDWLSRMAAAAAEHPQVAVLVFSGNAFTPCMDGAASPELPVLRPLHHRHRAGHRDLPRRGDPRLLGRDPDRSVLGGGVGPPRRHLPTACPDRSCRCDLRGRRRRRGVSQRWVHVAVALHEHRAELWPERPEHRALARRHPLLPGRHSGDRRRHGTVQRVLARGLPVRPCHHECSDAARRRAAGFVGRGCSMTGFPDGAYEARRNGPVAEPVAPCGRQPPLPAEPISVSRVKITDTPTEPGKGTDGLQRLHFV